MGKIIPLRRKRDAPPDNLIVSAPFEFRRSDWDALWFTQMLKHQSAALEMHRKETLQRGETGVSRLPAHHALKGGAAYTIYGMYAHKNDGAKMREVYYLAGLVDCMINQVKSLLRTDLIRDVYKKVMALKSALGSASFSRAASNTMAWNSPSSSPWYASSFSCKSPSQDFSSWVGARYFLPGSIKSRK